MVTNHKLDTAGSDAKLVATASSPFHNLVFLVRDDAVRSVRAIDRVLEILYVPADAREQKKRCAPDEADAIRLHGLGVLW